MNLKILAAANAGCSCAYGSPLICCNTATVTATPAPATAAAPLLLLLLLLLLRRRLLLKDFLVDPMFNYICQLLFQCSLWHWDAFNPVRAQGV